MEMIKKSDIINEAIRFVHCAYPQDKACMREVMQKTMIKQGMDPAEAAVESSKDVLGLNLTYILSCYKIDQDDAIAGVIAGLGSGKFERVTEESMKTHYEKGCKVLPGSQLNMEGLQETVIEVMDEIMAR